MTNYKLIGFLCLGIALTCGIMLTLVHEMTWAYLLFALAVLQALVLWLNWRKDRRRRHHYHPAHHKENKE